MHTCVCVCCCTRCLCVVLCVLCCVCVRACVRVCVCLRYNYRCIFYLQNNSIFSDIESTCHCGSIITCPMRVTVQADNCTKAVNSFNEDLRCKNASSDLSCPTLCHGSCRKLLKTISCECLAMTQLNHTVRHNRFYCI